MGFQAIIMGECYTCRRKSPEECKIPNSQECRAAGYDRLYEQEQEVIQYLLDITNNQIGVGARPISFLIASHAEMRRQRDEARKMLDDALVRELHTAEERDDLNVQVGRLEQELANCGDD